jgi:hypothetical protein
MSEARHISLEIGDPPKRTLVMVSMCESSVSLSFGKTVIHIPWTEIASWIAWLCGRIEEEQ